MVFFGLFFLWNLEPGREGSLVQVHGAVTLVAHQGKDVHKHVSGKLDMERPTPLTIDSLFRMYSQTKPVTAAVLLTLFEDGAFLLDDPVSKWIPEFAKPNVFALLPVKDRVRGYVPSLAIAKNSKFSILRGLTLSELTQARQSSAEIGYAVHRFPGRCPDSLLVGSLRLVLKQLHCSRIAVHGQHLTMFDANGTGARSHDCWNTVLPGND